MYQPKPRGWNYIPILPSQFVQLPDSLPYSFEYNSLAILRGDSSRLSERFWMNLSYPTFDASIQLSYKPIEKNIKRLKDYLGDSYTLTNRHQVKAYSIEEKVKVNPLGHTIVIESLEGEVPSQYQFFVTDSTDNFFRAALYFKTATKNDSLAIVTQHIKSDIERMIDTFDWHKVSQKKYHNQTNDIRSIRYKRK